jgi:hypothetical protein
LRRVPWEAIAQPIRRLAAQHVELVAQDRDLDVLGMLGLEATKQEARVNRVLRTRACAMAWKSGLDEPLGRQTRAGFGPWPVRASGIATIATGLLRRARMLLNPSGPVLVGSSCCC